MQRRPLGWDLAVWRLVSTLVLSLSGGFITYIFTQQDWLGKNILRTNQTAQVKTLTQLVKDSFQAVKRGLRLGNPSQGLFMPALAMEPPVSADTGCDDPTPNVSQIQTASSFPVLQPEITQSAGCSDGDTCGISTQQKEPTFWERLTKETIAATTMVIKFMMLAWFIGALIRLYVPEDWIAGILGGDNPFSIITAAMLGVPVYTSNLTAMPLVGGLLAQGMHPGAALAFLIAGPMTTLPAMSAVWGLVNRKVFGLYIGFALVGAIAFGYIYQIALIGFLA
jgi:uncharacterized membrane protein YraQ (UPF0718 family)